MSKNVGGFGIVIASPPNYKELVAEIYYGGKLVALVNQERGAGKFEVETPGADLLESEIIRRVDLRAFIDALNEACRALQPGPDNEQL